MEETIKSIIEWHEHTFPDATLDGQIEKFNDEHKEWERAETDEDEIQEAADMFIVCCGIARFSLRIALSFFDIVAMVSSAYAGFDDVINEKMQINRQRKWAVGKGNYQHVSEGE
jgi:hypothetical protein